MSPLKKRLFQLGNTSSNHPFSGLNSLLVSGSVTLLEKSQPKRGGFGTWDLAHLQTPGRIHQGCEGKTYGNMVIVFLWAKISLENQTTAFCPSTGPKGLVKFVREFFSPEKKTTWWWFQTFFIFTPYLGKVPILTSIFFRWVETTNQW